MSEQLYRWSNQSNGAWVDTEDMRQELIEDGVLVPVERCEHGEIDKHRLGYFDTLEGGFMGEWCPGSPTLAVPSMMNVDGVTWGYAPDEAASNGE